MLQELEYLETICNQIPPLLFEIDEQAFSEKPLSGKWSKKEILGHLLDSATNNHQRFIRSQFEEEPIIVYDQNKWNQFSYYSRLNTHNLIRFWHQYNVHICALLKSMPPENLKRNCRVSESRQINLESLLREYLSHLEHHLRQIVNYDQKLVPSK